MPKFFAGLPKVGNATGMSIVEVVFSFSILVAFLGVFLSSLEVVGSYLSAVNGRSDGLSLGWQPNRLLVEKAFDDIERHFSHPAVTKSKIDYYVNRGCVFNPSVEWSVPGMDAISSQIGYAYCLRVSPQFAEQDGLVEGGEPMPGFYVIQALPPKSSGSDAVPEIMPLRRLFCRPKLFC